MPGFSILSGQVNYFEIVENFYTRNGVPIVVFYQYATNTRKTGADVESTNDEEKDTVRGLQSVHGNLAEGAKYRAAAIQLRLNEKPNQLKTWMKTVTSVKDGEVQRNVVLFQVPCQAQPGTDDVANGKSRMLTKEVLTSNNGGVKVDESIRGNFLR